MRRLAFRQCLVANNLNRDAVINFKKGASEERPMTAPGFVK
jgi:hypothetical protein